MKKIVFFIVLILISSSVYAVEGEYTVSLNANNESVIGIKFPVYLRLLNPTNYSLHHLILQINSTDNLVCNDEQQLKNDTIPPKKIVTGLWTCGGRKVGTGNIFGFVKFSDSRGQWHSANLNISTEISPCQNSNCTLPIWVVGKNIKCIDDAKLMCSDPATTLEYDIPLIISKKPEESFKDLILTITSFEVNITANNVTRLTYKFFITPKKSYNGTSVINEVIFLHYSQGDITKLEINKDPTSTKEIGLFRIGYFDSKYENCYGEFYDPQVISYIDIAGGFIDYPIELEETYNLEIEFENAFSPLGKNLVSNFGIFIPVGKTEFRGGSVILDENLIGSAELVVWGERRFTTKPVGIKGCYSVGDNWISYFVDNTFIGNFTLENSDNSLKYRPIIPTKTGHSNFTLIEYVIQIQDKEVPLWKRALNSILRLLKGSGKVIISLGAIAAAILAMFEVYKKFIKNN